MIEIIKFEFSEKDFMKKAHDIRYEVFVVGQNCPEELEWEFEEDSTHFLLIDNGISKATARHRKTIEGYKLERFAVLESERGKGLGRKILKSILFDLSNFKGLIYLHAQVDVIPFYEKIGFIKEGDQFEEAGIQHYKMYLNRNC
ncbi:MAG: GNAT family N-acetyltransferase [Flavobacteriales bacterium]|nr:GNAT family N-acetyltransferase [Flavobacteriales bacterium]|tara:strand:+ start:7 stop:438 length:432 start_codon:yes stop_codon:yes gene_type:complete